MSQIVVYELLRELGGKATAQQIGQLAFERYPESTLHGYVAQRLRKLEQEEVVKHNPDGTWEIIRGKTFPLIADAR